uniref:hypothetical protein n=1 Tax=Marinobacterium profundum TaxID=1714300 RepID=UPI000ABC162C|nr:hypothetical protein [Marinobacterium profundum]
MIENSHQSESNHLDDREITEKLIKNIDYYWDSQNYIGSRLQKYYNSIWKTKPELAKLYKSVVDCSTGWSLSEQKNKTKPRNFNNPRSQYGRLAVLFKENWSYIKPKLYEVGLRRFVELKSGIPNYPIQQPKEPGKESHYEANELTPEKLWRELEKLVSAKSAASATEAAIRAIDAYNQKPTSSFGTILSRLYRTYQETFSSPVYKCFSDLVKDSTDWSLTENKITFRGTNKNWKTIRRTLSKSLHGLPDYKSTENTSITTPAAPKIIRHTEKIEYHLEKIDRILNDRFKGDFINNVTINDLNRFQSIMRDMIEKIDEVKNCKLD